MVYVFMVEYIRTAATYAARTRSHGVRESVLAVAFQLHLKCELKNRNHATETRTRANTQIRCNAGIVMDQHGGCELTIFSALKCKRMRSEFEGAVCGDSCITRRSISRHSIGVGRSIEVIGASHRRQRNTISGLMTAMNLNLGNFVHSGSAAVRFAVSLRHGREWKIPQNGETKEDRIE